MYTCLIVGSPGLIRMDLTETVSESVPGAFLLVAESLDEAAEVIARHKDIKAAFVQASSALLLASPVATLLDRMSCKVILMGPDAEDETASGAYPVLRRPYFADDVADFLNPAS